MSLAKCPQCGLIFASDLKSCPGCGYSPYSPPKKQAESVEPKESQKQKREDSTFSWWRLFSFISALLMVIPLYCGFDKLTRYVNNEYAVSKNVNAYVGGDAYNYIINANYATAYFVLAGVLLLAAIGFRGLAYLENIEKNS